jgi:hypothetical protein
MHALRLLGSLSEISGKFKPYFKPKTDIIVYGDFCEDLESFARPPVPTPWPKVSRVKIDRDTEMPHGLRLFKAGLGYKTSPAKNFLFATTRPRWGNPNRNP